MKQTPTIDRDTPILPHIVADCVVNEAALYLRVKLPRTWVRQLVETANSIYAHAPSFRRKIRAPGNAGRDTLYAFMRHWLAAKIQHKAPRLHARLPSSYNVGHPLP